MTDIKGLEKLITFKDTGQTFPPTTIYMTSAESVKVSTDAKKLNITVIPPRCRHCDRQTYYVACDFKDYGKFWTGFQNHFKLEFWRDDTHIFFPMSCDCCLAFYDGTVNKQLDENKYQTEDAKEVKRSWQNGYVLYLKDRQDQLSY